MADNDSKNKELDVLHESHNEIMLGITTSLNEIWDRIGFDETTKLSRLQKFFEKTEDKAESILESEEDLEEHLKFNIKEHRVNIKMLCIELALKYDDKFATGNKLMDERKILRDRLDKLQTEKTKRLEEFNDLSTKESELCEKLGFKKTVIKTTVPTEAEMIYLNNRIKELETLKKEPMHQMRKYKDKIMNYYYDLDISPSDSFSELIFAESIENIPLSEDYLTRANDLCEQLKVKDEKINEKIKSLKYEIRILWKKLNINNVELVEIVDNDNIECNMKHNNKASLIVMLNDEHERLKIKIKNYKKSIELIRLEMSVYFEKVYYSVGEIEEEFGLLMKNNDFTEDLLKIHEDKLKDLKSKYCKNQPLYEKTAKWLDLWQQFILFKQKTNDPNRFKQQGYVSIIEERERNQFKAQFSKLEDDLRKHADEYRLKNGGETFKIHTYEWNTYLDKLRKNTKKRTLTPIFQIQNMKRIKSECITGVLFGAGNQQHTPMLSSSKLKRTNKTAVLNNRKSKTCIRQRFRTVSDTCYFDLKKCYDIVPSNIFVFGSSNKQLQNK